MQPHNPENSRHGPGSSTQRRRNVTTFWLIIAMVALVVAVSATLIDYL
jgi:hypothetical protein